MCFSCDWSRYAQYRAADPESARTIQTSRRDFLGAGAVLAGAAATSPFLATEIVQAQDAAASGPADLIFRGGGIYTLDARQPWAEAVAVRGKTIVYVGNEAEAGALAGPNTRTVDLRGRMLLPGFVESHIHPIAGAAIVRGVDLQLDTRGETLGALEAYAKTDEARSGLVWGFGWRYTAFSASGPIRQDIDRIWPDRPVVLIAIDGHCAWVNSRVLALAGINRESKDPDPGFSFFQRDPATGEPTGYLVEVPAMMQVIAALSAFSPDVIAKSLESWATRASAVGITTVFDAGIPAFMPTEDGFELYMSMERRGKLPFRVVGSYYYNRPEIDPLPIVESLRTNFRSELVAARVLKINVDGGDAQYTAAMLSPYSDKPDTSGPTLISPKQIGDIVMRADAAGIDLHFHSYGDRAIRIVLDALEKAIARNPVRDRRNALAHCILVDPADVPRFAKTGAVAQFSAQWAAPDDTYRGVTSRRWGPERAARMYSISSVLSAGGRIAFGTDWPAAGHYSTFKPLDAIEIAMTRRELGKPDQAPLAPSESIDLAAALRAATIDGAWQLRMEDRIGSIEKGKLADLVVLDRNLFEISPHDIHKANVVMTLMNGRATHDRLG